MKTAPFGQLHYIKMEIKMEMPNKNPYIVFVFPVFAIAGIISSGVVFSANPLITCTAFGTLNKTMSDQMGNVPTIINNIVMTYALRKKNAWIVIAPFLPSKIANV